MAPQAVASNRLWSTRTLALEPSNSTIATRSALPTQPPPLSDDLKVKPLNRASPEGLPPVALVCQIRMPVPVPVMTVAPFPLPMIEIAFDTFIALYHEEAPGGTMMVSPSSAALMQSFTSPYEVLTARSEGWEPWHPASVMSGASTA